jgi:hypothetical protein
MLARMTERAYVSSYDLESCICDWMSNKVVSNIDQQETCIKQIGN